MAKKENILLHDFAFHDFLWQFYTANRGKIRSRYNELTKKFLDFNDFRITYSTFLRKPQFEALEMYVFIKEFMDNAQIYSIFNDWYNRLGNFAGQSYYSIDKSGQMSIYDLAVTDYKNIFEYMRKNATKYPNYIYALTMGLGKTILMATCIFYEFLLMNKYPKDKRFCHNALVFAPDKTVLESLREIMTFDKSKVVPREYCHILDNNIKFHFLDDSGTTLNTLDGSNFNIIISNTQKIIKKRVRRDKTPIECLFNEPFRKEVRSGGELSDIMSDLYGNEEIDDEIELMTNQRFEKLSRLQNLGIYVDEAHHMFGKDLQKSMTSLRLTINELAAELAYKETHVVACYNYTGTPYTENTVLPEVVYSYGLRDAIYNNYLKEADIKGYENIKNGTFLKEVIYDFWKCFKEKTYEGLPAKLAIFGATIEEVTNEIRPIVEEVLAELRIPLNKILVNVGNETITTNDDIKHFNDLDKAGTIGAEKQFILLCNKGREGWNCRSLFGVALFRSPKSTIFVLQATMRCLRHITDTQQTAMVRLSKENFDILDAELNKNFRMNIDGMRQQNKRKKQFEVHLLKSKKLILKEIQHTYTLITKLDKFDGKPPVIDFGLLEENFIEKYKSYEYKKDGLTDERTTKKVEIETTENRPYSAYTLTAEILNYLRMHIKIPCSLIANILAISKDGTDKIVDVVSKYNKILYDRIIPYIFKELFEVVCHTETIEKEVDLLRLPEGKPYYEFMAEEDLVVDYKESQFSKTDGQNRVLRDKSFHTDYYCFDSKPEYECFWQYIKSDKVKEVYFTGMFTNKYNGLTIQYVDPETNALRSYYPDFISFLDDDTIEIIEVKADNRMAHPVTIAKTDAAAEMATESEMKYKMIPSQTVMKTNII